MATRTTKTASKTTSRRRGRPTNAERDQRVQSQQTLLIDVAMAAASAAVKTAMGIAEGGVTTIGVPQGSQGQSAGSATGSVSTSQAPQSNASTSTASTGQRRQRQAPGRRVDPNSKMSQARDFYAANMNMERSDMVNTLTEKLDISKQVANTYVSNIDREHGYKLPRRRGSNRTAPAKQAAAS